ncbi:MAG: response regulator transcription factor [Kiritimatiellae bacterium]|nr:response regulator transcription factor [Kiritimatiellia bacterium]
MSKISILVADDHKIVRMGLKSLFAAEKDLAVVGEADDGAAAVRQALALAPDVIVMDLVMPKKDGVAATAEIHARLPETKIVVLTSYSTSDTIAAALAAGAAGAVMKSADDGTLLTAVRTVAAGQTFISPEVKGLLAFDPPAPALSPRQQEVLVSLVKGFNNTEIAAQLGISRTVVKEHVESLLVKLGAANRTEAAAIALRKHLVDA